MPSSRQFLLAALASLLFALVFWGPQYARRGHWEPDEARFVDVAREMSETRSFVIPRRNGEIYAHKPPLMMWLIQGGEALFGEPFGSRLPTLIGAFLSVLAFFSIAARLAGQRTAVYAVLVACTSVQFWTVLGRGQIDALLTGFVLSSAALFLSCHGKVATVKILPAFLCAGLAILAKGPVGLVLPALIVAAIRIPRRDGRFPELSPAQWCLGFAVALLVPALWLAAAALAGAPASYFREILFSQNFARAAGGYGHRKPFWYLVAHFPVGFLPWTLLLPAAVTALWRRNRALLGQCALWVLFVVLFFSIPVSKRAVYVLVAYPGAALAVAAAADSLWTARWYRRVVAAVVIGIPALLLVAGIFLLLFGREAALLPSFARTPGIIGGLATSCLAGAVLSGLCVKLLVTDIAERHGTMLPAVSLSAALFCVGAFALPALNPVKEPFDLVPIVERTVPADGRLLLFRIDGESLALHTRRRGLRVDDDDAMRAAMAAEGSGLAVFLAQDATNLLERFSPPVRETGSLAMGKKTYVWVGFEKEAGPSSPSSADDKP
jgi:4-amino-4-deoxy-L-arabinose transferase-like glycosyltransferase